MHNDAIRAALDRQLAAMDFTPQDAQKALGCMRGEIRVKKRMTFAMALVLALLLLSATAFGITQAVQTFLSRVADMTAQGDLQTWELVEKLRFVQAMREAGYAMDEGDYALLSDENQPGDARSAAADRIIEARYGELMRRQAAGWIEPPETVNGTAPDPTVIFKDAYYAEHPGATAQEYADVLGYYLRQISESYAHNQPETPEAAVSVSDESSASAATQSLLTEVYNYPLSAAKSAQITATYNESAQVWVCTARVSKSSLAGANEPLTDPAYALDAGDSYEIHLLVDAQGKTYINTTPEAYLALRAAALVWNYTYDQCESIAVSGIAKAYGLTQAQAESFFWAAAIHTAMRRATR